MTSQIRQATFLAMWRALGGLAVTPHHVIVDGKDVPPGLCRSTGCVVKGDASIASIAAASIVAKVTRDR